MTELNSIISVSKERRLCEDNVDALSARKAHTCILRIILLTKLTLFCLVCFCQFLLFYFHHHCTAATNARPAAAASRGGRRCRPRTAADDASSGADRGHAAHAAGGRRRWGRRPAGAGCPARPSHAALGGCRHGGGCLQLGCRRGSGRRRGQCCGHGRKGPARK